MDGSSLSAVALDPTCIKVRAGAWVEGALTSGAGFGAICRPLTDWPLVEARLCGGRASIRLTLRSSGAVHQLQGAAAGERHWPQALGFGLGTGGGVRP